MWQQPFNFTRIIRWTKWNSHANTKVHLPTFSAPSVRCMLATMVCVASHTFNLYIAGIRKREFHTSKTVHICANDTHCNQFGGFEGVGEKLTYFNLPELHLNLHVFSHKVYIRHHIQLCTFYKLKFCGYLSYLSHSILGVFNSSRIASSYHTTTRNHTNAFLFYLRCCMVFGEGKKRPAFFFLHGV